MNNYEDYRRGVLCGALLVLMAQTVLATGVMSLLGGYRLLTAASSSTLGSTSPNAPRHGMGESNRIDSVK